MSDDYKAPCGEYCAVVDECQARGAEIVKLRADLAAERERHQKHILDAMREWKESDEEYEAQLAATCALLMEARRIVYNACQKDLLSRIDAALKGDGE